MVHMYALKLVVGQNERRQNRMQNLVTRINPMKITKSFNRDTWLRCKGHVKMIEQKSGDCKCYYQRLRKCKMFTAKLGGAVVAAVLLEYVVLLE